MSQQQQERWTEIEHLPEWDEEFYHVYTARKFGKWVMLKTLKPELRDDPRYQALISKEFDVRYNLSNPNIVMINDFEDVPGLGRCIITDDVYGDSLRKLIDQHKLTPAHIAKLRHNFIDALEYIHSNHIVHHPLKPERIIFTENIGNLKLIDVGFDQRSSLTPDMVDDDIEAYGRIVLEALDSCDVQDPRLRALAQRCVARDKRKRPRSAQQMHLMLEDRRTRVIYMVAIAVLALMVLLLLLLPAHN